jgi:hypothetical protein
LDISIVSLPSLQQLRFLTDPEAILRRLTRSNVQHPTDRALAELGKAVKTIFLCRYLSDEALRREIHEGLNVSKPGTRPMGSSSSARAAKLPATGWTIRKCPSTLCTCCSPAWCT